VGVHYKLCELHRRQHMVEDERIQQPSAGCDGGGGFVYVCETGNEEAA
jgi:hypothetical protein